MPIALFAGLGGQEIIIIAVVALILFGATKVPQFMKGLGQGVKEFKDAIKDDDDPGKGAAPPPPAVPPAPPPAAPPVTPPATPPES